jgi:hypothetical protein
MFNNIVLDIVIGLVFIYLLYSLLATLLQELIAVLIGLRAAVLFLALRRMLDDNIRLSGKGRIKHILFGFFYTIADAFKTEKAKKKPIPAQDESGATGPANQLANYKVSSVFYKHPLIKFLSNSNVLVTKPSYISRDTFSKVMIDLLRGKNAQPGSSHRTEIENSLKENAALPWDNQVSFNSETREYLNTLWVDAQGDVERFKEHIERWFDEMMDRSSGWYRKYTKIIALGLGLVIAGLFNVDTLAIIKKLHRDPKLREQLVMQADAYTKAHPNLVKDLEATRVEIERLNTKTNNPDTAKKKEALIQTQSQYAEAKKMADSLYKQATDMMDKEIKSVNDLLGLGGMPKMANIPGLILTAFAISFGAPFWFDLLNKLIKLRSSVNPDEAKGKTVTVKKIERVG